MNSKGTRDSASWTCEDRNGDDVQKDITPRAQMPDELTKGESKAQEVKAENEEKDVKIKELETKITNQATMIQETQEKNTDLEMKLKKMEEEKEDYKHRFTVLREANMEAEAAERDAQAKRDAADAAAQAADAAARSAGDAVQGVRAVTVQLPEPSPPLQVVPAAEINE